MNFMKLITCVLPVLCLLLSAFVVGVTTIYVRTAFSPSENSKKELGPNV